MSTAPAGASRSAWRLRLKAGVQRRPPVVLVAAASKWAPSVLLVVASAAWVAGMMRWEEADIGPYGLVTALDPLFGLTVVCLAVSFAVTLTDQRLRRGLLTLQLAFLVLLLHGLPAVVETYPRFPTAWTHAGFVEFVVRTGESIPSLDARASWPAFFNLAAFISAAAGQDGGLWLLRWAPVAFNLLFLVPVGNIARSLTTSERAAWLTAWLFALGNWIGQDYFAPQAVGFFVFLILIAAAVGPFRAGRHYRLRRLQRLLPWGREETELPDHASGAASVSRAEQLPQVDRVVASILGKSPPAASVLRAEWLPQADRVVERLLGKGPPAPTGSVSGRVGNWGTRSGEGRLLVLLLVAMVAILVAGHQLTPVFVMSALFALVAFRRIRLRALPVLVGVLFVSWLVFAAEPFWVGHLYLVTADFGDISGNLGASLIERLGGPIPRQVVLASRIGMTLALVGLAALGIVRQWMKGSWPLTAFLLAASPLPIIVLQSYGGESLLRIVLFATPFLATLSALAFPTAPSDVRSRATAVGGIVLVSLALIGGFLLARFGNEQFERMSPGIAAAAEFLLDEAPPGSTFVTGEAPVPLQFRELEQHRHRSFDDYDLSDVRKFAATLRTEPGRAYLVFSRTQEIYGEALGGREPGWLARIRGKVEDCPCFQPIYSDADDDVAIYRPTAEGRR